MHPQIFSSPNRVQSTSRGTRAFGLVCPDHLHGSYRRRERGGGRGGSVDSADCPDVLQWPLQDM